MTVNENPAGGWTPAEPMRAKRRTRWATFLLLVAIVLLGAYFRVLGLYSWDEPSFRLHPDERFFIGVASELRLPNNPAEYFDSQDNPLNPRNVKDANGNPKNPFYVYGLLPQTVVRYTAVMLTPSDKLPEYLTDPVTSVATRPNPERAFPKLTPLMPLLNPSGADLTSYYEIHKVGRAWSVLYDLLSIVVTFLIGRRLYGRRAGLLAALLLALSVLPIQLSHFFTVDSPTALFTLLCVYCAVRIAQGGGPLAFVAQGLSIGAAMACRVTLATLGLLAVIAVGARLWRRVQSISDETDRPARPGAQSAWSLLGLLVVAGAMATLTFRVLQPDAFVGSSPGSAPVSVGVPALDRLMTGWGLFDIRPDPRFIENIVRIGKYVSGEYDMPPSQQWADRTPYLFSLRNLLLWGLGLPLGIAALVAWAVSGWQLLRRRNSAHLIPWVWVTFYMLWQGGQFVMTMRYYSSLYGLLAVLAAWGLVALWDRGRADRRATTNRRPAGATRRWTVVAGRLAAAAVVLGTLLWAYAFTRIYTQPHSRITASRWIYQNIPPGSTITGEAWDDSLPLNVDGRSSNQYLGLQTNPYDEDELAKYVGETRADGTIREGLLSQLDAADYVVLSSNRVYDSSSRLPMRYPALTRYYNSLFDGQLGFELVADIHSYPTLFGIEIPTPVWAEEAFSVYDHPRVLVFHKTAAYSREQAEQLITDGVAWGEVYKLSSLRGGRVPTALRLTEAQWPSFHQMAGFGGSILGSLAPWLVWLVLLEALGLAMFALLFRLLPRLPDRGFALAKTLGLLVVAYAAWLLGSTRTMAFGAASAWLCAGLLLGLGALAAWRSWPELRAFVHERRAAILTAEGLFLLAFFGFLVIRAVNPDLWHDQRGGEKPMDLAFLTAVVRSPYFPPYDPWFAGGYINYYYFGFVLIGTLVQLSGVEPTVAYNLAIPTVFALTAIGAWGVGYNLVALRRPSLLVQPGGAMRRAPGRLGTSERRAIATGLTAAVFVLLLGTLTQAAWFLPGTANTADQGIPEQCRQVASYAAQQECRGRSEWAFWDASRAVGMAISQRTGTNDSTITEFPFFTFLFGDLHAHMLALPLAVAALGLMVALIQTGAAARRRPTRGPPSVFGIVGLLALVVGALGATNTWDYPTYLGLGLLTLALVSWQRWRGGAPGVRSLLLGVAGLVALAVLSRALFLPFYASFATDYAGFELWRGERTGAAEFLKINGLWLFVLAAGAIALYWRMGTARRRTLLGLGAGLLLLSLAVALRGYSALLLLVPLVGVALGVLFDLLVRDGRRVSLRSVLPTLWAAAAVGIITLTELIVAKGDIGRMNTVFKLGMQSWVLFALASAVALVWLMAQSARWHVALRWGWRLAAGALVAAALVYPATATPARLADRFDTQIAPTLDGTAYMSSPKARWNENGRDIRLDSDADALRWMRQNITGAPIVLEAQTEGYRWAGRVSIYTGLPTLLGWPWHETQQRSVADVGPVLESRKQLIQQLYSSPDGLTALGLLRQYGVEYVYVGELERALYEPAGLAKFDALVSQGQLETVYAGGQTQVYHVRSSQQPPAILTTSIPLRTPTIAATPAMLTQAVDMLPAVSDLAWNGLAQSQPVAVLLWLLVCLGLTLLGLPLAVLVFGRWRDGGYVWARLIGLLLLGYAVWLPVSARLLQYDRTGLLVGIALVLALDVAVLSWFGRRTGKEGRATGDEGRRTEGEERLAVATQSSALAAQSSTLDTRFSVLAGLRYLATHLRAHGRQIALVEWLFALAFASMLFIRALNPDLWQPFWGGEKPFEFGFLSAILRSPTMPPYDPFFSGGTINYYYYGLFLASLPIKIVGVAPAIGFNLALPTFFALMVVGSFALVWQLTRRVGYGLLGVVFVTLLGNLSTVFQVEGGWSAGLAPVRAALEGGLGGFARQLDSWFVGPSRVVPFTINEFPYWSFLFGDLHPHLIAMPITLLAIALAYSFVAHQRTRAEQSNIGWPHGAGRWALVALTLGTLAVTNSWDFPTYLLLTAGAVVGAAWRGGRGFRQIAPRVLGAGASVAAVAGAALLLFLPFFQNFRAMVSGIGLVRGGTDLTHFLAIYGLFLAVLIPMLLAAGWQVLGFYGRRAGVARPRGSVEALGFVEGIQRQPSAWQSARMLAVAGVALLAVIGLLQPGSDLSLELWLGALVLVGVALLLMRRLAPASWFVALIGVLALCVALGTNVLYIRDHLAGDPQNPGDWYRMNTVFKFGLQVWVLLALAAAASLPALLRAMRRWNIVGQIALFTVLALLGAAALVYPLVATPNRVAYRFPVSPGPTLDGLAFLDTATYDWEGNTIDLSGDADAIRWLNANVQGTPVVMQSSMEFYRAYGVRVTANTGLPTVVSPLHESEQRDGELVAQRDRDVIAFYTTGDIDEALRLLSKYRVSYVYVGPIERAAYGDFGIEKFSQMTGSYLSMAYSNPLVQIYAVNEGVWSLAPLPPTDSSTVVVGPGAPVVPVAPAPQPDQPPVTDLEAQNSADPTAAGPAFGLAQRYRADGRLDEAAAVLATAAAANPSDVALHHLWGDILRDAGRTDEAVTAYQAAVAASPTAGNYNKLGTELLRFGRLDEAEQALMQANSTDANEPEPYFHLGELYESLGQRDKAIENYTRYTSLAPADAPYITQAQDALRRLQQ